MTSDVSPQISHIEKVEKTSPSSQHSNKSKRHTHWLTHLLLWLLITAVGVLTTQLIGLRKRILSLETQATHINTQVQALSTLNTGINARPTQNTEQNPIVVTPPPATSAPQTSLAVVTPPKPSANSSNTPLGTLPSIGTLTVLPSTAPNVMLPDWVRQTPLSIAQSFLHEGHWEAASAIVDLLLSSGNAPKTELTQLNSLRKVLQSQQPALTQMKKQLHALEKQINQLPPHSLDMQDEAILDGISTERAGDKKSDSLSSQFWQEVHKDIRALVQIESKRSANLRQKNEAAFFWKANLITSLQNYHLAWRKNDAAEQERLQHYIEALTSYAFDMKTKTGSSLQKMLTDYFKQPAPIYPSFPQAKNAAGETL